VWAGLGAQRAEEERALGSLFASLRPHECLVLEPGQAAQIATSPRDGADREIYLSATEVILRNGIRRSMNHELGPRAKERTVHAIDDVAAPMTKGPPVAGPS